MSYHDNVYYDTSKLSLEQKREIMEWVKKKGEWNCQTLKGFKREDIDITWEEALSVFDDKAFFDISYLKGREEWKDKDLPKTWCLEVLWMQQSPKLNDFRHVYLWATADEKYVKTLIKKYKLKPRKR